MPISRPPWTSARSSGRQGLDRLAQLLERRLARQLGDDVAVGGGDRQLRPDRRGALRHARQQLDAVEPHADRALVDHLLAEEQRGGAARHPRRGEAADHRDGGRRLRQVAQDGVGGNVAGSASMIAPSAPSSSGIPASAPAPSSISSTTAWNALAEPPSSWAAHTATAVPSSTSRRAAITPPAAQPTSAPGASAFVDRLERRFRRREVRAGGEHDGEVARPAVEPVARRERASSAPARASGLVERPVPMRTGMPRTTILRPVPPPTIVALFGPTGVGKTAVAIALADRLRAAGEDPVAVSADALQVYAASRSLTGAATPQERAQLEHRLLSILPVDATFSAGAYARARAPRDRRPAGGRPPPDRRRRHRPLPARRARRARPAPARPGGHPRPLPRRPRGSRRPALHDELDAPGSRNHHRATDPQRIVRALELLDAGHEPPAGEQLWTRETRHPTLLVGLTMEREALKRRIGERVDEMVAGRRDRGGRARGAGTPRRAPARRSASASCGPGTSRP